MDPVSSVNWDAHGKAPWLHIFKHLTFTQLGKPSLVCKKMREWILNDIVRDRFMKWESVNEIEGESCLKTFGKRNVVIALDCSASMTISTENWRLNVALKEVKAIVDKYKYLAQAKRVTLMPFATYYSCKKITNVRGVDRLIRNAMETNAAKGGIGNGNSWNVTFEGIFNRIKESPNKKSILYIISDFEGFVWTDEVWRHFDEDVSEPPIFNLCQVGKSIDGSSSINRVLKKNSALISGEPWSKKRKGRIPLEINVAHIPNEDGTRQAFEVSRTASTIEFERMQEESEEMEPTEIIYDEEEDNSEPELFVYFSSSSDE